ncbi:UNVERIFIED_CONTAM: hypothetical protein GTU68_019227 [Idotea baltica]|nr:hypothetical protein [Idotea baltica]
MLQQTRVEQGLPYYNAFTSTLPTIYDFERAGEDTILQMWEGLGYYSRARNMIKAAKIVVNNYDGKFPDNYDDLIQLPGIGPYSAAAISSICFDEARAVVDGNVVRVLSRVYGIADDFKSTAGRKIFSEQAQKLMDKDLPGDYNQAIMEFGARHCTPRKPLCTTCIFTKDCVANRMDMQDQWPTKRTKSKRRHRTLHYFIFLRDGNILLQKRNGRDIYKGLYQLPLIENDRRPSMALILKTMCGYGLEHIISVDKQAIELDQTLSHQEIHARFYIVKDGWIWDDQQDDMELVLVKNLSNFAMPRILRRFFTNFELLT